MPVTAEVTPLEENRVRIDVAVSDDEVRRKMDRTVRDMAKNMRIPGFRPGRVPAQVVLKRIGVEAVMQQVLETNLGEWYASAVQTAGVRPIDDPEVDLGELGEDGVSFSATVKLPPTPELGEYRGLEVVRDEPEIPEGALDAEIDRLREQGARLEVVDRPIAEGDFAVIDYDGTVDGRKLPAASTRDLLVEVAGGRLLPAFSEGLTGVAAGEEVTFGLDYPDSDQRPELAGKTVEYTVRVKKVQAKVLPEPTDEFAAEVSEFDTYEELRADIQRRLDEAAERIVTERFRRRAIDAATAAATIDLPEVMVDRRVDQILADTARQLPQGISLERYLQAQGQTLDQARAGLRVDAELSVRRELVIEAIVDAEAIEVTDEELEAKVRADAAEAGRDADRIMEELRKAGMLDQLRQDMRMERAVDLVVESAVPVSAAEADAKEKIWTPDKAGEAAPAAGAGQLWTPDQPGGGQGGEK
ncbi:MAG: trigger factor [Thermoleophilia bacterium]|jgi:trigger factor|nr:trigger factor [Thermoleophilia bacterium]